MRTPDPACWRCGGEFAQTDDAMLRRCTELATADPAGDLTAWLRRHGIDADWYHRNPCHGRDGCWVLHIDGENPPPEIHLTCPPAATRAG